MKDLKNGFSNKIIIYQMTLLDRIFGIWSAILLTGLGIFGLIIDVEQKVAVVIYLIAMIIYCLLIFYMVFKTYICLDIINNRLIIRENPGFSKRDIPLDCIKNITILDGDYCKENFIISINLQGNSIKIHSWSSPPDSRIAFFAGNKKQRKRLEQFCEKCNQYLNSRQKQGD